MKISEVIKELEYILKKDGDLNVFISCGDLKKWQEQSKQDYIISEPVTVVSEDRGKGEKKEVMIRDWMY